MKPYHPKLTTYFTIIMLTCFGSLEGRLKFNWHHGISVGLTASRTLLGNTCIIILKGILSQEVFGVNSDRNVLQERTLIL